MDDVLDYISTTAEMGKKAGSDLESGVATAPVLYAAEEFPEIKEMMQRDFSQSGDVERVCFSYVATAR